LLRLYVRNHFDKLGINIDRDGISTWALNNIKIISDFANNTHLPDFYQIPELQYPETFIFLTSINQLLKRRVSPSTDDFYLRYIIAVAEGKDWENIATELYRTPNTVRASISIKVNNLLGTHSRIDVINWFYNERNGVIEYLASKASDIVLPNVLSEPLILDTPLTYRQSVILHTFLKTGSLDKAAKEIYCDYTTVYREINKLRLIFGVETNEQLLIKLHQTRILEREENWLKE
jgi:hypothetical protein